MSAEIYKLRVESILNELTILLQELEAVPTPDDILNAKRYKCLRDRGSRSMAKIDEIFMNNRGEDLDSALDEYMLSHPPKQIGE
jgi:hypothetical protein